MKLLIIADDLTGALDSSVAFARHGFRVLCALSPERLSDALAEAPDVISVSTNSRELAEKEAIRRLEDILSGAREDCAFRNAIIFKKVDSRLKGHVRAELAVLAGRSEGMLVCPAIPRLGRLVKNGAVCGAGVDTPIDIAKTTGCQPSAVPEATSDADIDAALEAALADDGQLPLLVGAAGLAQAVARRFAKTPLQPEIATLPAPALFAIGSRDPVTVAQMTDLDGLAAPNGHVPETAETGEEPEIIQMTAGHETIDSVAAGTAFAAGIAARLQRRPPRALLACGGETAAAIAHRIGCGLVEVDGEVLPGLPVSRMLDGMPGLTFITKSGGFGEADTLVKLINKLVTSPAKAM
ncbi:four-carbon acid sugar kinase family protein [Breoghania sp.]|uniref:four-carbon acid sugar kinase family protein n=1 Tax=Breoghania sp. TaxID=2065378 RepID=UPI0029CA2652|nr:four-carbon acid sugar kinase family protein [Breoghania sp.]